MRLSMWTLLDRLGEFAPDPFIKEGQRVLRNARLLSESQEFSRTTVYLQQNDPTTIMCVNGPDSIAVHSDDIDLVLNTILDVFDHCNEWAGEMDDLIRGGCTLKQLLERAAHELEANLIVADATYLVYENAEYFNALRNEFWNTVIEQRSMALDDILHIDRDPKVRAANAGVYFVSVPEYDGAWPVANIFINGEHQGWLIGDSASGIVTRGFMDKLDYVRAKVEQWLMANGGNDARHEYTGALSRLLEGERVDAAEAQRALAVAGWRDTDALRVYTFRQRETAGQPTLAIERFLRQLGKNTLMVPVHSEMALIVNETLEDAAALHAGMSQVLELSGYVAGESPLFHSIAELPSCYQAACVAVAVWTNAPASAPSEGNIAGFDDVKLAYALRIIEDNAVADVRHPALSALRTYDDAHGTQLLGTLESFVRNRGSYVDTYEELFIHRSTLAYRLERICALTGLDFADARAWGHLVISFLLDEAKATDLQG